MEKIIKGGFRIGSSLLQNHSKPYVIAEMACAHNGNIDEAKQLIKASVDAGADAVQLQFLVAEETVTPFHEAFDVIKSIEFSVEQWKEIVSYARKFEIDVFTCTYDVPSVALAVETKCDGIKLNSADLSNPDVLAAVAKSGIPLTLGTGASTLDEINEGLEFLKSNGAKDIVLMHGVQNFPTAVQDLHINRLEFLMDQFPEYTIGYADHTDGENSFAKVVDLLAVAKGVGVIEKHITLCRADKGIDYQAALEPEELKAFVSRIDAAYQALGSKLERPFSASDLKYRKFQKKGVVAARELKEGETITRNDVLFIRNVEPGLPPKEFGKIEGQKLKVARAKFDNITVSDIE